MTIPTDISSNSSVKEILLSSSQILYNLLLSIPIVIKILIIYIKCRMFKCHCPYIMHRTKEKIDKNLSALTKNTLTREKPVGRKINPLTFEIQLSPQFWGTNNKEPDDLTIILPFFPSESLFILSESCSMSLLCFCLYDVCSELSYLKSSMVIIYFTSLVYMSV